MFSAILILLSAFVYNVLVVDNTDTDIKQQVEHQVYQYVENIKTKNNVEHNAWALSQIATQNCETFTFVKSSLNDIPQFGNLYSNFHCRNDEDLKLLIDSTKKFWHKSDQTLFDKIINDKILLSDSLLSPLSHLNIHLELMMRRDYNIYYSDEYLKKSIEVWSKHIENKNVSTIERSLIVSNIIWAAYILYDYDTINAYSDNFINSSLFPYSKRKLRLYGIIDFSFYAYGQYDKSLVLQRNHSLPLAEFIGEESAIREIKQRQGAYLYAIGKFESSLKIYEELYSSLEDFDNNYSLFNNLSINYYELGFTNKYIKFQLSALDQNIKNYESLLKIYRNLFIYYTNSKDINSALEYVDKAKDIAAENSDTTELALIDSYLGTFYWTNYKDAATALKYLTSAEEIISSEKNYAKYSDLIFEKGDIFTRIDSLDKAEQLFRQGKELALSKSNTLNYVIALINLTLINLKQRDLIQAGENLEEIKLYPLDNLDFASLTKFFTVKAEYLSLTNKERLAIEELRPIISQVIDRAKNNTDSQQGYWSVEEEYLDAFALMVNLLIKSNQPEEALKLLDQFKTINDASLYNSPLVKAAKLSEEDLAEEKRLNQRLQLLRKKYLNASQESRFEIKTEINRVSAEREQILSEVNLNKDRPLSSIWSIQRLIDSDELVLHFTEIGDHLYVSHLTNNEVRIQKLEFSAETQERFNAIGDEIASGKTNLNHLYELYQFLDLDDIPSHINQISVVPDNYLYRIPLEVLPVKTPDSPISFGSARYLIEDHQFRYFTSLKEFESNRRSFNTDTENTFSAFAISNFKNFESTGLPSLPYATVETHNINAVLTSFSNSNKKIYTETEATKNAFKQQVGSSRMVHVATHSEVSEQDPLFSTIYLKNSNPGDTLESDQALYAYELFDTPLNSEFIMLNSCSSGSGNYIQGSGIMGISRALRYAGAKSLALNLWSVNDKVASEFATDFYGFLNEGETKSEAIRKAKLNQIKGANANPHFWGAYMMIGNPSPVTEKPGKPILLYSLLGLTIFFIGYSTYKMEAA